MTPTYKNPAYKKRVAIAPYNFVPLPEAILTTADNLPSHDVYNDALLTGKITCTLTTSSPLYVRAARTQAEYENGKTPSDPYYGDTKETLLIPGSSLRGMLRNLVEVVSYSRISPVTKKPLFYRTVDVSSIGKAYGVRMSGGDAGKQGWFTLANAGYMEMKNGDYFIRPAREIFDTQHFRVHEEIAVEVIPGLTTMATQRENRKWAPNRDYKWAREKVWFKPVAPTSHLPESPTFYADVTEMRHQDERPEGNGWEEGFFIAGGWVPSPKGGRGKKRHWIVGPASESEDGLIFVSDEDVELYRERTGGSTQAVEKQKKSVLPAKEGEKIPCFYTFWKDEEGEQRVAFGHTGMFRLPYLKSPGEMLPDALKKMDGYDLAEAMFGFVDQAKNDRSAVAGRVSVTDAIFQGKDPKKAIMDEMMFSDQALSSPKPTTVQHYLTQSAPDYPENLKHYDSDPNTETSLRGHKFYWHVGASEEFHKRLSRAPEVRKDSKPNVFKPVKANQTFSFDIHFENLHPHELGALLWVLDKASGLHRLKLGMGKPFGLGSIEITYDVTLSDRQNRYSTLFADDQWNEGWMPQEAKDTKVSDARERFAQYVLQDKRINPSNVKSVDDLPRIKELLALLDWQNKPAEEMTRYMDLDEFTGRKNIFKELTGKATRRPVLPAATKVLDNRWFAGLPAEPPRSRADNMGGNRMPPPAPSRPTPRTPAARTAPEVKTPPPGKRERPPRPELPKPVKKKTSQLVPGDIITGIVEQNTGAGKETWLTLEHGGRNDRATIPAGTNTIKRYKKGEKVLLEVRGIEGDMEDGFLVTCNPVDL
jgi:CRISPR-associated protein (TIGR03986 family)